MTWLRLLSYVYYALTVVAGVTVLFAVAPAYKQTRHRGFLLLTFGTMLRIFDLICDYTIGRFRMPRGEYVFYHSLRWFAAFAAVILLSAGIVVLTRSYLTGAASEKMPNI
jgi:hypothetical protein